MDDLVHRFLSFVDIQPDPKSCWEWKGALNKRGYGSFSIGRKTYRAHRISYALVYKTNMFGLFVCHACDNPSCVRPTHLFLGTNRELYAKGRAKRAEEAIAHFEQLVGTEIVY